MRKTSRHYIKEAKTKADGLPFSLLSQFTFGNGLIECEVKLSIGRGYQDPFFISCKLIEDENSTFYKDAINKGERGNFLTAMETKAFGRACRFYVDPLSEMTEEEYAEALVRLTINVSNCESLDQLEALKGSISDEDLLKDLGKLIDKRASELHEIKKD